MQRYSYFFIIHRILEVCEVPRGMQTQVGEIRAGKCINEANYGQTEGE